MKYLIQGLTKEGQVFRPSDWAERLCTAMASYRVNKRLCIVEKHNHKMQGYSECVMPVTVGGVKSVVLDTKLKDIELMAFDFVMAFAKDNNLTVLENYGEQYKVVTEQAIA
jgi:hypothetical protein